MTFTLTLSLIQSRASSHSRRYWTSFWACRRRSPFSLVFSSRRSHRRCNSSRRLCFQGGGGEAERDVWDGLCSVRPRQQQRHASLLRQQRGRAGGNREQRREERRPLQLNTNVEVLSHVDAGDYGPLLAPIRRVGLEQRAGQQQLSEAETAASSPWGGGVLPGWSQKQSGPR